VLFKPTVAVTKQAVRGFKLKISSTVSGQR